MATTVRRIAGVESPRKVLHMLMSFSEQRPTATAEDLAQAIRVPLSTAYRYIALLREVGLVEETPGNRFVLSSLVVPLARAARAANSLQDIAEPIMRKLAQDANETVLLIKRMDHFAICVSRVDSNRPIRLSFEIGRPVPLAGGAAAKVLLAAMPADARKRYLAEIRKSGKLGNKLSVIEKELDKIAESQWAVSSGEVDDGIWAAAAAVTDGKEVQAALTIAGLADHYSAADQARILSQVRKAAEEISQRVSALRF